MGLVGCVALLTQKCKYYLALRRICEIQNKLVRHEHGAECESRLKLADDRRIPTVIRDMKQEQTKADELLFLTFEDVNLCKTFVRRVS
ncbi:MAG: hypothetical protein ABSD49_11625 [Candidatus Bathyarchaeia archaeon]